MTQLKNVNFLQNVAQNAPLAVNFHVCINITSLSLEQPQSFD
jgi:hypothetical protein